MEEKKKIVIKGAREHNLKNIDVTIPRGSFTVITGVSGSGKSSLAFDTLYAEGQRRYVESLSSYARQFLGMMKKPDVDYIEGLSPSISIEQKKLNRNPRSTVGTVTEIYDYLRLLYTHAGTVYCHKCGRKIQSQTIDQIVDSIMDLDEKSKLIIMAPIAKQKKGTHKNTLKNLAKMGFYRIRIDGEVFTLEDEINLSKNKKHNIEVIIDRIVLSGDKRKRIFEAVEQSLSIANEKVLIQNLTKDFEKLYSTNFSCLHCDISYPDIEPAFFSFNSPQGACEECHGLGFKLEFDEEKILDFSKSIKNQAIKPFNYAKNSWFGTIINAMSKVHDISLNKPLKQLTRKEIDIILYGSEKKFDIKWESKNHIVETTKKFEGVINTLKRRYHETNSDDIRSYYQQYMREDVCSVCNGNRLNQYALSVKIKSNNEEKNIIQLTQSNVEEIIDFIDNADLKAHLVHIVEDIFKEIVNRLTFLKDVGLGYLTLDRKAYTLSGGEGQRIHLATQIGSQLVGVLYVLDEPTIGLHQRDNLRLINTLKNLQRIGNTLLIVEHDDQTIHSSDYIVDIGPRAGIHGGKVEYQGEYSNFLKSNTLTAKYLRGEICIPVPKTRRKGNGKSILLKGAAVNNLKSIDIKIPLNTFSVVTGVSGSGKSSLIIDLLYNALKYKVKSGKDLKKKNYKTLNGHKEIEKVIHINQSPIGRTPRSNPATYTGVFDHIRKLFSTLPESKIRGYKPGRFSFNVKGGRCENCNGAGVNKIEMQFLPDVFVECEVCKGKRFNSQTLEIRYKGKTIADVLDLSIEEAYDFFDAIPSINRVLKFLIDVGLGYLKLGQPAPTLSGGEAQRMKLTKELSKKLGKNNVYFLDEPTTGLHFDDVAKLVDVIQRLVDKGNTVVVIEHNMDLIKVSDYIIDLGPEGGKDGGELLFQGQTNKIIKCEKSYTAKYVKEALDNS